MQPALRGRHAWEEPSGLGSFRGGARGATSTDGTPARPSSRTRPGRERIRQGGVAAGCCTEAGAPEKSPPNPYWGVTGAVRSTRAARLGGATRPGKFPGGGARSDVYRRNSCTPFVGSRPGSGANPTRWRGKPEAALEAQGQQRGTYQRGRHDTLAGSARPSHREALLLRKLETPTSR